MPTYQTILYVLTDGVLTITLNRPEAYNAFNTPQWGSFNSNVQFNAAGQVVNKPTQVAGGSANNRFGFGALNAIRPNSQRILQVAVKLYF